jgi:hypothetical protein
MKLLPAICLLLAALTLPSCGEDSVSDDNRYERNPWVYNSGAEGEYVLHLVKTPFFKTYPEVVDQKQIIQTTKIRKNLLSICHPYGRKQKKAVFKVENLPDELYCGAIGLTFNYDDGISWDNVRPTRRDELESLLADKSKHSLILGRITSKTHWSDLDRYKIIRAEIEILRDQKHKDAYFSPKMVVGKKTREYEGFEEYLATPTDGMPQYFDVNALDGIQRVDCVSNPAQTNAVYFCHARLLLNPLIIAKVGFIDFRHHGGRLFLQERVRAFKKIVCPIIKCDTAALREAEVVGGF